MSNKTPTKTVAKVIDDALVIDLQTAIPKSTWRCSMDQLGHAGFMVKTKGKTHGLFLKMSDKEENIAKFENIEDAEKTLDIVTKALLKPSIPASISATAPIKKSSWFKNFIMIIVIAFLVWGGLKLFTSFSSLNNTMGIAKSKSIKDHKKRNSIRKGVPLSADELFGD